MASSKTVALLGSAGTVGPALLKALATKFPSVTVLAGTRDPAAAKAQDLLKAGPNVKLVAADLNSPASLVSALPAGLDAVFVNTPGDINRTKLAINGIDAAKATNAKHVVVVSVLSVEHSGIFTDQFQPIEAHIKASGIPYTILRLPLFIDNNWASQGSIKEQGKIYGPVKPDALLTPIAVSDIAAVGAAVLANPGAHVNKTYKLATKPFSHNQLAAAFAAATGKAVEYVQVPYDAAKSAFLGLGYPEWQVDGILELYHHIDAGASYYAASDDVANVTGTAPVTVEQWTAQVGTAFK